MKLPKLLSALGMDSVGLTLTTRRDPNVHPGPPGSPNRPFELNITYVEWMLTLENDGESRYLSWRIDDCFYGMQPLGSVHIPWLPVSFDPPQSSSPVQPDPQHILTVTCPRSEALSSLLL